MVKYALQCEICESSFDGWFSKSADFDQQKEKGLLTCPVCGSVQVAKALMAPMLVTGRQKDKVKDTQIKHLTKGYVRAVRKMHKHVAENFDNVGRKFATEARAMHRGEKEERPIYGEATAKEAKDLVEEGVQVAPLPLELPDPDEPEKLN